MGEPPPTTPKSPTQQQQTSPSLNLIQPPEKKRNKPKVARFFRSVFRSLPIITPICKFPGGIPEHLHGRSVSGSKVTGTLFGFRKGRVSLSIQENPKFFPYLIIELAIQTLALQKELGSGMVRIALECEKKAEREKVRLLEEPLWTMFCNGKKNDYGVKREASEDDLKVMELLRAVSMGAGVLPGNSDTEGPDGEYVYIRAHFERVVGSKDSETLYMISPDGNNGPELSIFFIRV